MCGVFKWVHHKIACRYLSGRADRSAGVLQSGYDPTLGEPTYTTHVVTGVSNHSRGAMPITGTFFDQQGAYLGMTVTVQTERLVHAPDSKLPELSERITAGG